MVTSPYAKKPGTPYEHGFNYYNHGTNTNYSPAQDFEEEDRGKWWNGYQQAEREYYMDFPILYRLNEERIFEIHDIDKENKTFYILEKCDEYFSLTLTREEMLKLGQEIINKALEDLDLQ